MKNVAFYDLKANEKIVNEAGNFSDTPLVLLWAKEGIWLPGQDKGKNKVWTRMKNSYLQAIEDMNTLSSNMKIEFANTTEHNIHFYEPETVIDQLNYLLSRQ